MNSWLEFPDFSKTMPKFEQPTEHDFINTENVVLSRPQPSYPPSGVQDVMLNVVPAMRRWSCGDSQHAADELPAPNYHNLGFFFHNHIQMSNHRYSSDFDCAPTASAVPTSLESSNLHQLPTYDQSGALDLQSFVPNLYGNTGMRDSSYFEIGSRSLSTPNVTDQTTASTVTNPGLVQSYAGRRRFRTNFTEHQSMILEDSFKASHYPDHKTKRSMAEYLNIPEDRITVWFQNRRAKWRRKEHRHRDRNKTDTSFAANTFAYTCFTNSSADESMGQKMPSMYELPPEMPHAQFESKFENGPPEYQPNTQSNQSE